MEKKRFFMKKMVLYGNKKYIFYTQLVDDNTPSAAAADVPAPEDGRDYPWVALLFLARRLITHKKTGKDGKFLPLKRDEPMQFGGGWVGQTDGTGDFQPPDHKIIFGVNLHEYEKDLTDIMLSLQIKYIPTVIEMQNILTIMILLEHELIHVAYGIYRNVENYSETRLATLDDFPRLNLPKGTKWSKSKYEFPTEQAFTDTGGHGPLFSKYANLLFGFLGQQSPLDEMSKKKRKRGEIQRDHYTTHAIISKDQAHNIPPTQGGHRKSRKKRGGEKKFGNKNELEQHLDDATNAGLKFEIYNNFTNENPAGEMIIGLENNPFWEYWDYFNAPPSPHYEGSDTDEDISDQLYHMNWIPKFIFHQIHSTDPPTPPTHGPRITFEQFKYGVYKIKLEGEENFWEFEDPRMAAKGGKRRKKTRKKRGGTSVVFGVDINKGDTVELVRRDDDGRDAIFKGIFVGQTLAMGFGGFGNDTLRFEDTYVKDRDERQSETGWSIVNDGDWQILLGNIIEIKVIKKRKRKGWCGWKTPQKDT